MSAKTQNLNTGGTQALHALLHSIAPGSPSNGERTPDIVQKLSNKLSELMGERGLSSRNESGELVNEEGLPIIDISEPLTDTGTHPTSLLVEEENFVPLASLPLTERERRRRERDRLLDLLEEEEAREQARVDEVEVEERQDALQRRKDAAKGDLEKLKAAKEMQKKMGKALLRNMAEARERAEKTQKDVLDMDTQIEEGRRTLKTKKSVSFVDLPEESDSEDTSKIRKKEVELDWGDVTPARLRPTNRPTLVTKAQMEKHPMKMDVVERMRTNKPPSEEGPDCGDSDDDSAPPASPLAADSDEGDIIQSDQGDDTDSEGHVVLEEEFDIDFARHQREIALEYHKKRVTIGEDTLDAMASHTHPDEEDDWDQPVVPLEATLSAPHPKPSVSRFKASRLSSPRHNNTSNSSSSKSLPSVVPAATSRTIQHAVKVGKLDSNNQLIGDESGSEDEDDVVKEVLELLKKGEIHNIGPDGNLLHPPPVEISAVVPPQASTRPVKTSKFKLATSQAGRPGASRAWSFGETAGFDTPVSSETRSSPKLAAGDSVIERRPFQVEAKAGFAPNSKSYPVINSPSFLPPANPHTNTVIDSPSFPRDAPTSRRPVRPPMVMTSSVRETTPGKHVAGDEDAPPRKVSRFLAERM